MNILYSFRRCPYAMRARLALAVSGQQSVLREVVLRDKPAALLEASPKGTVPVLVLACGTVIDESLDVMHWAFRQNDPANYLLADGTPDCETANLLIQQNDTTFKDFLDRYKYPHKYTEGIVGEAARGQGMQILYALNARLGDQAFLLGSSPTIADLAIFPFVRQFAHVDRDWFYEQDAKALQKWLIHWLESELFRSIMKKYAQWHLGDDVLTFP